MPNQAAATCAAPVCSMTGSTDGHVSAFDTATGKATFSTSNTNLDGTTKSHTITCVDPSSTPSSFGTESVTFTITFEDPGPDCSAATLTMTNPGNGVLTIAAPGGTTPAY